MGLRDFFSRPVVANTAKSEAERAAEAMRRFEEAAEEMTSAWEQAVNAGLRTRPWIRWADNTVVLTAAAHKTVYDPAA